MMTKFAIIKLSTLGAAIGGIVGGVVGFLAGLLIGSSLASTFNKLLDNMVGFSGTSTYTLIRKSGMLLPNANIVIDLGSFLGSISGGISAGGASMGVNGSVSTHGFSPVAAY